MRITNAAWMDWPETQTLVRAFAQAKKPMRFVGGAVRDSLLDRPVQDVDIATPARPEEVTALLERAGIRAIPTGIDHGTVTALIGSRMFEITTLRRDIACDGRHAEVEYTDDWQQDAARRDFTINALSATPEGEVFDYFGGLAHLRPLRIIFIGDASARIREDALRILRFFRFSAQLGVQEFDVEALTSCAADAELLSGLSGERIAQEMLKLLAGPALTAALPAEMQRSGVLRPLLLPPPPAGLAHPALASDALARLALWLEKGDAAALSARWKLSGAQQKTLHALLSAALRLQSVPAVPELKKLLRAEGQDIFRRAARIAWAHAPAQEHYYAQALILAEHWHVPQFPLTGADLLARGYAEGKPLGEALKRLEQRWEAADYALSREDLLKLL